MPRIASHYVLSNLATHQIIAQHYATLCLIQFHLSSN